MMKLFLTVLEIILFHGLKISLFFSAALMIAFIMETYGLTYRLAIFFVFINKFKILPKNSILGTCLLDLHSQNGTCFWYRSGT